MEVAGSILDVSAGKGAQHTHTPYTFCCEVMMTELTVYFVCFFAQFSMCLQEKAPKTHTHTHTFCCEVTTSIVSH